MTDDAEVMKERRSALAALGIDPDTVVFPSSDKPRDDGDHVDGGANHELTDQEWEIIAPLLPSESRQAHAIANRDFVNLVLWIFARAKHWTQIAGDRGEAARKRFGRWAHASVWQVLYAQMPFDKLGARRKAQLGAIADRAERLRKKAQEARLRP